MTIDGLSPAVTAAAATIAWPATRPGAEFGTIAFHNNVPDEDVLLNVHAMLTERATAEGGVYDGWETQLII